jgi:excisionase family DNA binding protein
VNQDVELIDMAQTCSAALLSLPILGSTLRWRDFPRRCRMTDSLQSQYSAKEQQRHPPPCPAAQHARKPNAGSAGRALQVFSSRNAEETNMESQRTKESEGRKLSVADAASVAGVSRNLVYAWCAERRLPHYRLGGRGRRGRILIDAADLEVFLQTLKVQAEENRPSRPCSGRASPASPAAPFSELDAKRLARAWRDQ